MIQKVIGQRIKELRTNASITQEELAYRAGLDRTYINSVENGRRNLSIVNVEKIAGAFGFSVKDFFDSDKFGTKA
ncbi:MAG: helix-turn-helix domain-containing protein [Spirochaetaceae bacterium]|jgi:transcriptional regulator with XRE-family HTH domain|nr:helix-turn-helix domain-containing protein [Spirochaetaceae bacterium]